MITVEKLDDIEKACYEHVEGLTYEQQVLRRVAHQLERLVIGDHVQRTSSLIKRGGGFGTVVAIVDDHATVLWSDHPDAVSDLKLDIKKIDIKASSRTLMRTKWIVEHDPDEVEFEFVPSDIKAP